MQNSSRKHNTEVKIYIYMLAGVIAFALSKALILPLSKANIFIRKCTKNMHIYES